MSKLIRKSNKGFTLIELMIVVAIIGILAAIAIPNFLRFQLKSKSSEGKVNVAAIRTAEEAYNAEFGEYIGAIASPPVANIGPQKVAFTDEGVAPANFGQIGWSPEGNVFFSYGVTVNAAPATLFTATATADIDDDATVQSWGYVKSPDGVLDGIVSTVDANCVATGVGAAQDELSVVGPCVSGHGSSIF
jgi:type IV pilus assembly protein PilA